MFWNEINSFMMNGRGVEMINSWKEKNTEYLVASMEYVVFKRCFINNAAIKTKKSEFYDVLGVNFRSCFRSFEKLKNFGLPFPESGDDAESGDGTGPE
jgi:hypothetical protein